jgi:hypothetical protein
MTFTTQQAYERELATLIEMEIERLMDSVSNGHLESFAAYRFEAGKIAGLRLAQEYLLEAERICREKY